jgi:hypothetical protein
MDWSYTDLLFDPISKKWQYFHERLWNEKEMRILKKYLVEDLNRRTLSNRALIGAPPISTFS